MERRDVEIMAPVGSFESLMAAIQGGAGSVYFGVEHLNMRSRSSNNFTLDDLVKISEKLLGKKEAQNKDEFGAGYRVLAGALKAPFKQIAKNANRDDAEVIIRDMVKAGGNMGWDASDDSREFKLVDMLKAGIIDPTKVERAGIENAASAASVLLTTSVAVVEEEEEKNDNVGGMGGAMPGMF